MIPPLSIGMSAKDEFTDAQEREFLAWVRKLPSCLTGQTPCQACHVLRVNQGSGKGIKPKLMAVPMTAGEHRDQTNHGYLYAINKYASRLLIDTEQDAIEWFENQALRYRKRFLNDL